MASMDDSPGGTSLGTAYVDVKPRVSGLAKVARIIEYHMGALAADLELLDKIGQVDHVAGDRPPRH